MNPTQTPNFPPGPMGEAIAFHYRIVQMFGPPPEPVTPSPVLTRFALSWAQTDHALQWEYTGN